MQYLCSITINVLSLYCHTDEEHTSESHLFYKTIPPGFFGSKKVKSARDVKD